ncbi:MarR family transcriptional regulator [Variovorax rhizosphaerae]|uniref:MarR family transcriptional regulator n=1 Tax=Variovorax rhizosphaerae TaxID=1836200 RepID=A0ABU8WHY6_9BURK
MSHAAIDFLTYRLDVFNCKAKALASGIYEQSCGVSLRELRVLRLVAHQPGITQGEVADPAQLEKPAVSRIVKALIERGLMVRETGTQDARSGHLFLTEHGHALVQRAARVGRKLEKSMLSVLSDAERESFEQCLARSPPGSRSTSIPPANASSEIAMTASLFWTASIHRPCVPSGKSGGRQLAWMLLMSGNSCMKQLLVSEITGEMDVTPPH